MVSDDNGCFVMQCTAGLRLTSIPVGTSIPPHAARSLELASATVMKQTYCTALYYTALLSTHGLNLNHC